MKDQFRRENTLLTHGFEDLAKQNKDFERIINSFKGQNLHLDHLEVGGTYFRVLKLHLSAIYDAKSLNTSSLRVVRTYYPLLSTFVRVKPRNEVGHMATCLNEVKRTGYIIDLHQ